MKKQKNEMLSPQVFHVFSEKRDAFPQKGHMWKSAYAAGKAQAGFPHKWAKESEKSTFFVENNVESVEILSSVYAGMHRVFIRQGRLNVEKSPGAQRPTNAGPGKCYRTLRYSARLYDLVLFWLEQAYPSRTNKGEAHA